MNKFSKRLCYFLLSCGSYYSIDRFVSLRMHGFSYLNFTIQPPKDYRINFTNPPEMEAVLRQTFTYFSYGGESLVFTSSDGEWVLKTFKKKRLYPYYFIQSRWLPFKFIKKRPIVYERFWHSLKVQAEHLADVTALSYVHLPKKDKPLYITLVDPMGSQHRYNFEEICFVLQKKGVLFKKAYQACTSDEQKKFHLAKLVEFYKKLDAQGFKVWDNAVTRNIGWLDGEVFLIDTGAACIKPEGESLDEILKYFKSWVRNYAPDQQDYVLGLIADK